MRFSDNIAPRSRSVSEGRLDRSRCQQLLQPYGLHLKEETGPGEKTIADLNAGEETQLLGFTVGKKDGEMTFGVGSRSWESMKGKLVECHTVANPQKTAQAVVDGWVTSLGPVFEKRRRMDLTSRVVEVAKEYGFRETDPEHVHLAWYRARVSWEQLLTRTEEKYHELRGRGG